MIHLKEMLNLFYGCKLSSVIITHPDKDHYSYLCDGLIEFVKNNCSRQEDIIFFIGGGYLNSKCENDILKAF